MGQEISGSQFKKRDFEAFDRRLRQETDYLEALSRERGLSQRHGIGGFELEAWLVDGSGQPAPINEQYLQLLDGALVSPELSRFNIELNSTPRIVAGSELRHMYEELEQTWRLCRQTASTLDADLVMIGILPTITDDMLTLANMSEMERYRALNQQVMRLRQGRPLRLDIVGEQHLRTEHRDVMLEAATTSFQVHLQVAQEKAARYFNAMLIASAPLVAVSANSPLLFGKRLWQETRIPLFEQAVSVGGFEGAAFGPVKRVTFGSGYVRHSLLELFTENVEHYPLLLPTTFDEPLERMAHLRLHNGTIWRWNRPLVGFDEDGVPHFRIENRVIAAGPSTIDSIANAVLLFGLVHSLAEDDNPPEAQLDFVHVRDNLYAAARHGLHAHITWLGDHRGSVAELFSERLLPLARKGLLNLGVAVADIDDFLGIIEGRLLANRTGASWQLEYLDKKGGSLPALVGAYLERQNSGLPVHRWQL